MNLFKRTGKKEQISEYQAGYGSLHHSFGVHLNALAESRQPFDSAAQEEMLAVLIQADVGLPAAEKLVAAVLKDYQDYNLTTTSQAVDCLLYQIDQLYDQDHIPPLTFSKQGINVILMVGVNGSGKTTSISKLACYYMKQGYSVGVIAADTFRAGAIQQIEKWCEQLQIHCFSGAVNADPSSVLVDGCRYYKQHPVQIIIADTAGRLQNKVNLMNELSKMKKVIGREIENAPQQIWLTVDATTGQNGLSQAANFIASSQVSGVILTKMDGTSRGGIFLAIRDQYNLAVRFMTVGEKINDLIPFDINDYLNTLLGDGDE